MKIRIAALLLASTASFQPLSAQTISPPQMPENDIDCPQSASTFNYIAPSSPCTFNGTRTVTPGTVTVTPNGNGSSTVTGAWNVAYAGNLAVDGIPITLNPVNGPFTFDATGFFGGVQQSVNVTAAYSGRFTNFTVPDSAVPLLGTGYFQSATVNALTVNSINVSLQNGQVTDTATGQLYDYSFSTPTPNVISGGNSVALVGAFQRSETPGELVFGKLTGDVKLLTGPVLTNSSFPLDASGNPTGGWGSLAALQYNVTATQTTTLNADGLTTPTISVTNGINTNGSRISNVGNAVAAGDAVNLAQLNAAVASGNPYVKVNSASGGATASGIGAVAIGADSFGSADDSLAIGTKAKALGVGSIAIGADGTAVNGGTSAIGATASGFQSVALGVDALASNSLSVALGSYSQATGTSSVAIGLVSTANGAGSTAVGEGSLADGVSSSAFSVGALALGYSSTSNGNQAQARGNGGIALGAQATTRLVGGTQTNGNIAIGSSTGVVGDTGSNTGLGGVRTTANGGNAVALGTAAQATGLHSTALGADGSDADENGAVASGTDSIALGVDTVATSGRTTALGVVAQATGFQATAVGANAVASGTAGVAVGVDSQALGFQGYAGGVFARAVGDFSMAFGRASFASGTQAVAIGALSSTAGANATAIGGQANATAAGGTALGGQTTAGLNATAIGLGASATFASSTAIGTGAATTRANQIVLGTTSNSVTVPGLLTTSDAAQTGTEFFVTVDSNGTLGKGAQSGAALTQQSLAISDLQSGQAVIDDQVAALQSGQSQLFDLARLTRKESRRGIAAAVALTSAPFPSAPGKTSYSANVATYRGETGMSASFAHRLNTGSPFAITGGVSHAGGKDTAARVGVAGEF